MLARFLIEHSITASSLILTLISLVLFKNDGDEDDIVENEDEPPKAKRKRKGENINEALIYDRVLVLGSRMFF